MRRGFTVFSANDDVDPARKVSAVAADIFTKWRRFIFFSCRAESPAETGSMSNDKRFLGPSRTGKSLGMTEDFDHDATQSREINRRCWRSHNASWSSRRIQHSRGPRAAHSSLGRKVARHWARLLAGVRCRSYGREREAARRGFGVVRTTWLGYRR